MPKQTQKNHVPVLLDEVLELLAPKRGEHYADFTAGYGGHAREIIERTKAPATLVDRDENAVRELKTLFKDQKVEILYKDFLSAAQQLVEQGKVFDLILADLGVSSPHLDKSARGFSIQEDGPLDMRMDQSQSLTGEEIINTYSEVQLTAILRDYGEEPKAKRIARLIVEKRPLSSTQELAQICKQAWPGHSRVHPATRTFQAIRIAVNDELGQLEAVLPYWVELLKPGGRLAIISFHSLEDALVKRFFQEHGGNRYDADLQLLTKKPVVATEHEIVYNPRSRSARLRVSTRK